MTSFAAILGLLVLLMLPSGAWTRCPRPLDRLYTAREWQILARLIAILGLSAMLLVADRCQALPGALFLYGRF